MLTILLLIVSNTFMTLAWYGHLKYRNTPLITAILVSWLIALAEYCFQVPANRIGYGEFTGYQLKIIQEIITLAVFSVFAYIYLGGTAAMELCSVFRLHPGRGGVCVLGEAVKRETGFRYDAEKSSHKCGSGGKLKVR